MGEHCSKYNFVLLSGLFGELLLEVIMLTASQMQEHAVEKEAPWGITK